MEAAAVKEKALIVLASAGYTGEEVEAYVDEFIHTLGAAELNSLSATELVADFEATCD